MAARPPRPRDWDRPRRPRPTPAPPPAATAPVPAAPPGRAAVHDDEYKLVGWHACLAVFAARPGDIVRAYLAEERTKAAGPLLAHLAAARRAYKVIPPDEMQKVSGSEHHEGICLVVKTRPARTLSELQDALRADGGPRCLVALEDVGNPHNVGAILRVCAHFGARDVLCLGSTPRKVSAALARTAEGGAEHVDLVDVPDAPPALRALKEADFTLYAAAHDGALPLYATALPPRLVLLLGSEHAGLSARVRALADGVVAIGGTGRVESLNVATAVTALLGEYWRQHPRRD